MSVQALGISSLAIGVTLVFFGPVLVSLGAGFIAAGLFALVHRWHDELSRFIAARRRTWWIPEATCAAALIAFTLLMLGNVAAGDRPVGFDHAVHYFQAWQVKERFWKDGWFFWSHLWFAGYPANYTYPVGAYVWIALVHWLTFGLFSFSWAYAFGFWLFYVFHGFSVYFLGKVAFNRMVGLVAALLYLMDHGANSSGGWFWIVDVGAWPLALSIAFSTVATALLTRILEAGRRRDVIWCAVLIGLALISHPLQLVYVPVLCCVACALSLLVPSKVHLRTHGPYALAAVGCGLLIGAAWYLPFLAFSQYSRAYGFPWVSLEELGANVYMGTIFPGGATLMSGQAIKSEATTYVPFTVDGLTVYVSVLAVLVFPILFLSKRLLPLLLSTLTLLLVVGASSTVHEAIGLPTWWAGYSRMEFPRYVMLYKPFLCVAAAAGLASLWIGARHAVSAVGLPRRLPVWNGYLRVLIAVSLLLFLLRPAFTVVLNRHVFQRTPTRSSDVTVPSREALVAWMRQRIAEDPRFFRIAAMGRDKDDHTLTDLGTELPVPFFHLGFTPAVAYVYNMSGESQFFPPASDSNDTLRALNVRYVIAREPLQRSDLKLVRTFGLLALYEFIDWSPNPYVVTEGEGSIDVVRFDPEDIELRAGAGSRGRLRLNVSYFPRWSASRDGQPIDIALSSAGPGTGFMTVDLAPGTYRFRFRWGLAEWMGIALALAGVGGLLLVGSSKLRGAIVRPT